MCEWAKGEVVCRLWAHLHVHRPHLVGEALLWPRFLPGASLDPRIQWAQHAVHRWSAAEVPRHCNTHRRQVHVSGIQGTIPCLRLVRILCFQAAQQLPHCVSLLQRVRVNPMRKGINELRGPVNRAAAQNDYMHGWQPATL